MFTEEITWFDVKEKLPFDHLIPDEKKHIFGEYLVSVEYDEPDEHDSIDSFVFILRFYGENDEWREDFNTPYRLGWHVKYWAKIPQAKGE